MPRLGKSKGMSPACSAPWFFAKPGGQRDGEHQVVVILFPPCLEDFIGCGG
jgi:hypothetical protein